jgi:hypothetical protein
MGNRAASLVAAICWILGTPSIASALERNADEQQVLDEFSGMAALAKPLGIAFNTIVVDDVQDGDTPMAMGYDAGTCTLVVQVRNNSLYKALVLAHDGHSKALKVRAILAHEMGHCFRHYFGASAMPDRQDVTERARARDRRESELQADRFALAWTAIYNPSEYDGVRAYLQTMRSALCPDKTGRYPRPQELDADTRFPDVEAKSATAYLVGIATVHQTANGPAGTTQR